MTQDSDFVALTDQLYVRPPAEFVAARDELARQARATGDRVLATRIKALRRPSVGAWYLNSAARAHLPALDELIHLGQQLRDAQSRGDFATLRDLASRRGPLTGAVLRELDAQLGGIGVTPTPAGLEEARTTLASSLADPEVAEQLTGGRLDRAHVYAGFGNAPDVASSAPPVSEKADDAAALATAAAERRAAEEAAAREELAEAEAELAARTTEREAAETDVRASQEKVAALTAELADAQNALKTVRKGLGAAADRQVAAQRRVDRALRAIPK